MSTPGIPSDEQFKLKTTEVLTRIETKVDMLISADGETGRVPAVEKRLGALEKRVWLFNGGLLSLGALSHYGSFLKELFIKLGGGK